MKVKAKQKTINEIVIRLTDKEAAALWDALPTRPWNAEHTPATKLEHDLEQALEGIGYQF